MQATSLPTFSFKKFLNTLIPEQVFMFEDRRVVAGEAILSQVATTDRTGNDHSNVERSRVEHKDEVLEGLVREHARLVYGIAYAALRHHHDAEDATQETFLRVLRYSSRLEAVEDPKTWLARIAWRVAVGRGKQHGRRREISLDEPDKPSVEVASSEAHVDETVFSAQVGAVLERLIAALPTKLRQPLILSTIEEMSPRDVAATLGINQAAVRSRVFRARQILRQKLAERVGRK